MPTYPTAAPRPPCPKPAGATPHVMRNGSIQGRQRYRCRGRGRGCGCGCGCGCGTWVGGTHGPPMYRLRTPPAEIGRALLVVMRRGSLGAAEAITGHKDETISHWVRLAAAHAAARSEALVRDLGLSTLEVDEGWSFCPQTDRRRTASDPPAGGQRWGCLIQDRARRVVVAPAAGRGAAQPPGAVMAGGPIRPSSPARSAAHRCRRRCPATVSASTACCATGWPA